MTYRFFAICLMTVMCLSVGKMTNFQCDGIVDSLKYEFVKEYSNHG